MNNTAAYEELLAEGVRAEMLRAVLEAANSSDDSEAGDEDAEMGVTEGTADAVSNDVPEEQKLSTASDNATFLASRLVFTHDSRGQPIALDAEGNGVMMGWESGIMQATARRMCESAWADRGGRKWDELVKEEDEGEREPLRVMNVGFGLGIVRRSAACRLFSRAAPN